jgi:hypothetical protein
MFELLKKTTGFTPEASRHSSTAPEQGAQQLCSKTSEPPPGTSKCIIYTILGKVIKNIFANLQIIVNFAVPNNCGSGEMVDTLL